MNFTAWVLILVSNCVFENWPVHFREYRCLKYVYFSPALKQFPSQVIFYWRTCVSDRHDFHEPSEINAYNYIESLVIEQCTIILSFDNASTCTFCRMQKRKHTSVYVRLVTFFEYPNGRNRYLMHWPMKHFVFKSSSNSG